MRDDGVPDFIGIGVFVNYFISYAELFTHSAPPQLILRVFSLMPVPPRAQFLAHSNGRGAARGKMPKWIARVQFWAHRVGRARPIRYLEGWAVENNSIYRSKRWEEL
jgi:hypothetical protein